jgi:hypothetical protein
MFGRSIIELLISDMCLRNVSVSHGVEAAHM